MQTRLTVHRDYGTFEWVGDLPLVPEGQRISTPEVACTMVVSSLLVLGDDGQVLQRLEGR